MLRYGTSCLGTNLQWRTTDTPSDVERPPFGCLLLFDHGNSCSVCINAANLWDRQTFYFILFIFYITTKQLICAMTPPSKRFLFQRPRSKSCALMTSETKQGILGDRCLLQAWGCTRPCWAAIFFISTSLTPRKEYREKYIGRPRVKLYGFCVYFPAAHKKRVNYI